jgi:hypothetical protein
MGQQGPCLSSLFLVHQADRIQGHILTKWFEKCFFISLLYQIMFYTPMLSSILDLSFTWAFSLFPTLRFHAGRSEWSSIRSNVAANAGALLGYLRAPISAQRWCLVPSIQPCLKALAIMLLLLSVLAVLHLSSKPLKRSTSSAVPAVRTSHNSVIRWPFWIPPKKIPSWLPPPLGLSGGSSSRS